MKIVINEVTYQLTDEQIHVLTTLFHGKIQAEYEKLEPTWRLAAKAVARGALGWIEERIKQEAGLEASIQVRPPKKADPVPHLLSIGERLLVGVMHDVTLSFRTTESREETTGTIEGFTVGFVGKDQSQDGGPLDSHGDIRVREDHSLEVPGQHVHEAVS